MLRLSLPRRAAALLLMALPIACTEPPRARTGARSAISPDSGPQPIQRAGPTQPLADDAAIPVVQSRPDWALLVANLPRDAERAAAALEIYRADKGLPMSFFVRPEAPPAIARLIRHEEDDMCGGGFVAYVPRIPLHHSTMGYAPAYEIDSTGRTVREWPLPDEADYWEIVRGVHGDELIADYRAPNTSLDRDIYLRIKPSGEYHVSAIRPEPLGTEDWIMVADSVWMRVRPASERPTTRYASGHAPPADLGRWVPDRETGWYVRADSGSGPASRARVETEPATEAPMVPCPSAKEFEGMLCRDFPDGETTRRIAYPIPCT